MFSNKTHILVLHTMTNLLFLLTFLIAVLEIDDLKAKPVKFKPWMTLILLVIATVITYFVENQKEKQALLEKKTTDSLADVRVKNSNKQILQGFGDAIGKYSLGYDSAKKEIARLSKLIRDSANRKTTVVEPEIPSVLFHVDDGVKLDYL
jgi:hypothetical protein